MARVSKPKLGQNFLVDEGAQRRIVEALGDVSERTVVEIGPGHGALTELLAARCKRLVALEIDSSLAAELSFRFRESSQVEVVEGDVLKTDLAEFASGGTLDVIGNLPYYITSDILLRLFASASLLRRGVLMMQREVAQRVSAQPGVREYGLLSATTQMYAAVESLFTLPPEAFLPPPDVYSSVVRLEFSLRFAELAVEPAGFDRFLKQVFAQKRKTLSNNLRVAGYTTEQIADSWPVGLPLPVRAEQVPLEVMAELYRRLSGDQGVSVSASAGAALPLGTWHE